MNLSGKVFYFAIFFILGVLISEVGFSFEKIAVTAVFLFLVFIFIYFLKNDKRFLITGILFLSVFVGYFYDSAFDYYNFRTNLPVYDKEVTFTGTIVSYPKDSGKSTSFLFEINKGKIVSIFVNPYNSYSYQDDLKIKGKINPLGDTNKYLEKYGAVGTISFPEIVGYKKFDGFSLRGELFKLRDKFSSVFERVFNSRQSSLMSGILLGQESASFPTDFKTEMKNSGTTHLVALSGYNISVLINSVYLVLGFFLGRRSRAWLSILFVVLFVFMSGAESSVIRAAVMGSLGVLAGIFSRIYSFKNSMVFTAFIMVVLNPKIITLDLGFILSFASLFGIAYIYPILDSFVNLKNFNKLKEIFFQTFAAQIMVIPILSAYFGQFSLSGLVSNLIILLFIPATMFLGFTLGMFGVFSIFLAKIFSIFPAVLLYFETGTIHLFGSLPLVPFQAGLSFILFYYFVMAIFIYKFRERIGENNFKFV